MISEFDNLHPADGSSSGQPMTVTRNEPGETLSSESTNERGQLPPPDVACAGSTRVCPSAGAQGASPVSIVPHGMIQPIADVPAYLAKRAPVMLCDDEAPLLITLPLAVRLETRALCSACGCVLARVQEKQSVQSACQAVIGMFFTWHWKLQTFRPKYDLWVKAKDWLVLVNRAKAGAAWINRDFGLADEFLDFVAGRCGEFKRGDALPAAIRSFHRPWQTGCTHRDEREAIPGYGFREAGQSGTVPQGWTIGNLRKQLQRRAKYLKAHKAMLHEGIAAARSYLPQVRSTREGLRFMEDVQFDDVKCDFRVFDTSTGKPVDLWLLIAHDRATAMLLGFGMRPATVREDGSQEHLKLRDMKQLSGWLLERYGLPPYPMTWKVENGTATYDTGTAAALQELLKDRLNVSFSLMIRGNSPSGYLERALGNSKGKASLESHNRQIHMIGAGLPGQVGMNYGLRPKDLAAREKECSLIWQAAQEMPAGLRARLIQEFGYPLLTVQQARRELVKVFSIRNTRTDHNLEGFEPVLENRAGQILKRMETPSERAKRLCEGLQFTPVSPEIITAFYEHTQRAVIVSHAGEIEFSHEGRKLTFSNPILDGGGRQTTATPGQKLLAYYHPDDPRFLHLTDGAGRIVGTWMRRALVKSNDRFALAEAMRLQASALKAAKARATELNSGEVTRLNAMRERNARLLDEASFVDVAESRLNQQPSALNSPVAAALATTRPIARDETVNPVMPTPADDCTADLLAREQSAPDTQFD